MGAFAAPARELGWDVYLLFNRDRDSFHFVDYLAARLGIGSGRIMIGRISMTMTLSLMRFC